MKLHPLPAAYGWPFQVMLLVMYLVLLFMSSHALLGLVRTALVRLPLRPDDQGMSPPLFYGDYTIHLYEWSGTSTKLLKMVQLMAIIVVMWSGLAVLMFIWYGVRYSWFPGPGYSGVAASAILFVAAHAYAIRRGRAGAEQ